MTFAFLALLGTVQDPDLRPLFERLAADDIEVREDAGRRIVALGRKAEPELRSLIRDPSRAAEARGLLFRALAGNDFASRLLKHLPDLDEHDAWEDDRTWLRLFQKVREGGEALRALRLREFERVFPELLRAGRAEDLLHTVLGEVTHA